MMLVIGVYGRVDWTITRLARARHPTLPAGDAYLRFMEEREDAGVGALASTRCRHEVRRRKSCDTLTGDVFWTLRFHRPFPAHKMQVHGADDIYRPSAGRASSSAWISHRMLPALELTVQVIAKDLDINDSNARKDIANQLRAARHLLAARVAEAHR